MSLNNTEHEVQNLEQNRTGNHVFGAWYRDFQDLMTRFDEDALFVTLNQYLHESQNIFAINRKLMRKTIDVSWVEALENGLVHVDNYLRHPGKTIEDQEEIVPIALSRKTTVESVKHLAQHTDMIQSYDKATGKIIPSKILNVHKEESLLTYENKFINTLIDRLYLFVTLRYEKLAQIAEDEQAYTLAYQTDMNDGCGGKYKISLKLETITSLETKDEHGNTLWQRVEKLKRIIEGYKGSELCMQLGNNYIRPPVMRTNAILKNVDLRACLTLWQYVESYDKIGYDIAVEDTVVRPDEKYLEDFYKVALMNLILFRSGIEGQDHFGKLSELKIKNHRIVKPKFIRQFDDVLTDEYSENISATAGYISADGEKKLSERRTEDSNFSKIYIQIDNAIKIEKNYQANLEEIRLEKERKAEEAEQRRQERKRLEELRIQEQERIALEKAEERRQIEEMLAKKRAEQEEEERERKRLEQERLQILEQKRQEEAERQRIAEEQQREEEESRRLAKEKILVRSELGEAEEMTISEIDIDGSNDEITEEPKTQDLEFEDPRELALREKKNQQKREQERKEKEYANRLRADRAYYAQKPFSQIRKEYSKNPIRVLIRAVQWVLVVVFHIIPKETDNPDWKKLRLQWIKRREEKSYEKAEKKKMEVLYRKYAQTYGYRLLRLINNQKFKWKKAKERRKNPLPKYVAPQRSPEEEKRIQAQMKQLYQKYHVSIFTRIKRRVKAIRKNRKYN